MLRPPLSLILLSALLLSALFFPVAAQTAENGNWPMWGYSATRSHTTPHALPTGLYLHWERQLPEPQRAWPWQMDDFEKLDFDASYEPVVYGDHVYLSSMVTDSITAYDLETGEQQWRYVADGPVRLAPTVWNNKVYAVSDDGNLYCLNAETGALQWNFNAAPTARKVLGNNRVISMWPSRGGPVVYDGIVYFAAGIWPHEGVFIYALDADTAEVLWDNSRSASEIYIDSKRYYSFGGVAPQGQLVVEGDYLLVPGGRTVPAVFNRHTGEFLYLRLPGSTTGKGAGGHHVFTHGDWFFNVRDDFETHIYALEDGAQHSMAPVTLASERALFGVASGREMLMAYTAGFVPADEEPPPVEPVGYRQFIERGRIDADGRAPSASDRMRSGALSDYYQLDRLVVHHVPGLDRLHMKAGTTLYGSGDDGRIFAIDVSNLEEDPEVVWMETVSGKVFSMVAARDRLFVTTAEGHLYCFGPGPRPVATHRDNPPAPIGSGDTWTSRVATLLSETGADQGYALLFGVGSGRLLEELLTQSQLHIVAFDSDPDTVARLREQFIGTNQYGRRVALHHGDIASAQLPPYVFDLVVSEDPASAGYKNDPASIKKLFHPVRPYGGAIYLALSDSERDNLPQIVDDSGLEQAVVSRADDLQLVTRPGPLPGAGAWTHQYADAGNSAYSADKIAKTPLGITWFGGVPNHKTLPRHMHGPIPQVVSGKVIMLGVDHISARCVYTGRHLWATELPLVGKNFTSFEHEAQSAPVYFPNHPGANFIGSPYISGEDNIYLIHEDRCLKLDTATGAVLDAFDMPDWEALKQHERDPVTESLNKSYGAQIQEGDELRWGNLRHSGDWLVVAAYPHLFDDAQPGREENWNATSSEFIVVMNRHTGEVQWVHQSRYGFRHNAIAASADRVFVIDNLSEEIHQILRRRGIEPDTQPQVRALDLVTGDLLWTYDQEVFGTSLSYSKVRDVLIQSGHPGRRRALPDEPQDRLVALSAADGAVLWSDTFLQRRAPLGMHASRGQVVGSTGEPSVCMFTGEQQIHHHPMTDLIEDWTWIGALRCGTQNFSEFLVAFRSGAVGVADLSENSGTAQIAGFRPGCTNSLVAADGMLNAPDYTRSCSCSYQFQTSVGLTHMPEVEMWVFNSLSDPKPGTLKRIGINLGAPGSRLEKDSNVLWVEYPMVGGPAPEVLLELSTQGEPALFRRHSLVIENENGSYPWVAASGIQNVESLRLDGVFNDGASTYTVRLHFTEPEDLDAGQRIFDVYLQGERVADNMDIAREVGGKNSALAQTFTGVRLGDALHLELKPGNGTSHPAALSGVELIWEG